MKLNHYLNLFLFFLCKLDLFKEYDSKFKLNTTNKYSNEFYYLRGCCHFCKKDFDKALDSFESIGLIANEFKTNDQKKLLYKKTLNKRIDVTFELVQQKLKDKNYLIDLKIESSYRHGITCHQNENFADKKTYLDKCILLINEIIFIDLYITSNSMIYENSSKHIPFNNTQTCPYKYIKEG